jgi:ubiquinone/menaquinone biosynthesis C-methylase UbiE
MLHPGGRKLMNDVYITIQDFVHRRIPVYQELYRTIKMCADTFGTGLSILDVPTVTGNIASLLQQDHDVTTVDLSEAALRSALKKNSRIKTKKFNAYKGLPFDTASFDGIVSTHFLYFLSDKDTILGHYYRVLKPGGFLIITEFDGYKTLSEILSVVSNKKGIFLWKTGDIVLNFFSQVSSSNYLNKNELMLLLKKHHFTIKTHYKTFGNLSNTFIVLKNGV